MLTKLFEKKNKYLCVAVHKVESGSEKKCFQKNLNFTFQISNFLEN